MGTFTRQQIDAMRLKFAEIQKGAAMGISPVRKAEIGPQPGDMHVNAILTNIMLAYLQDQKNFVAKRVFPIVPTQKQSDTYFKINKGDWNRDVARARANGAPAAAAGYSVSTDTYFCDIYAAKKAVTDQDTANADNPLNPDTAATQFVANALLLRREMLWIGSYLKGSVWSLNPVGAAYGTSPTFPNFVNWDDYGSTTDGSGTRTYNSNPPHDVARWRSLIKKSTGFKPNKMAITDDVFVALQNHPLIIDRVKYTHGEIMVEEITEEILAGLFGLNELLVIGGVVNTANAGQTDAMNFMANNKALLVYAAPAPSLWTPSAGYTFAYTNYVGASAEGSRIKKYRWEEIAGSYVEGELAVDQKLVAADLGCYISSILASPNT